MLFYPHGQKYEDHTPNNPKVDAKMCRTSIRRVTFTRTVSYSIFPPTKKTTTLHSEHCTNFMRCKIRAKIIQLVFGYLSANLIKTAVTRFFLHLSWAHINVEITTSGKKARKLTQLPFREITLFILNPSESTPTGLKKHPRHRLYYM